MASRRRSHGGLDMINLGGKPYGKKQLWKSYPTWGCLRRTSFELNLSLAVPLPHSISFNPFYVFLINKASLAKHHLTTLKLWWLFDSHCVDVHSRHCVDDPPQIPIWEDPWISYVSLGNKRQTAKSRVFAQLTRLLSLRFMLSMSDVWATQVLSGWWLSHPSEKY